MTERRVSVTFERTTSKGVRCTIKGTATIRPVAVTPATAPAWLDLYDRLLQPKATA